jgi:uncharacterized protein DUF4349
MNSIPRFLCRYLCPALLLALIGAGCHSNHQDPGASVLTMKYSELGPPPALYSEMASPSVASIGTPSARQERPHPVRPRMVIMNAELDLEVQNYSEALNRLKDITALGAGFIVNSTTNSGARQRTGGTSGEATIRIPSAVFNQTVARIESIATKVEHELIRGNDVTDEFYDVAARLTNKQNAEAQYQHVFARANSVKDILQVEEALLNVREEIEQLAGRKKYLTDQVDLSTIGVRLHEPLPPVLAATFGSRIVDGFQRGVNGFTEGTSTLVMIVVSCGPYLALLLLGGYLFLRVYRSRQNQSI